MDARLTAEQEQIRETAEQLARDLAPDGPAGLPTSYDSDAAWQELARAGLLGMRVPERAGGAPMSGVEVALVVEQLGRFCVPVPFIGSAVCASQLLSDAGASLELMESLAAGRRRLAPVLDSELRLWARPGNEGIVFESTGVEGGLVLDEQSGRLCCLAAEDVLEGQDLTRELRMVAAGAIRLDVGDLGSGLSPEARCRALCLGLAALSADLVGVMQGALDRAVAYMGDREQFGVKIGTFQALQHMAAEALVSVEAARGCALYAAWAVDALPAPGALEAARTAKAYASEHARQVCETAIQMHGGIGLTWEAMPHVYLRRALVGRLALGDEHHHYACLADERLGEAEESS